MDTRELDMGILVMVNACINFSSNLCSARNHWRKKYRWRFHRTCVDVRPLDVRGTMEEAEDSWSMQVGFLLMFLNYTSTELCRETYSMPKVDILWSLFAFAMF